MINESLFSSQSDEWSTPQDFFNRYDSIYHFTLDVASTDANAKCDNHFTIAEDGLKQNWGGQTVWLNPPYGRQIGKWVEKAYQESRQPNTTVVCLLPARTDTKWFHDYCKRGTITFIRGRLKFGGSRNSAPFPSMVVVFRSD
jgi:phage N-6-adenine-methyltransferase